MLNIFLEAQLLRKIIKTYIRTTNTKSVIVITSGEGNTGMESVQKFSQL